MISPVLHIARFQELPDKPDEMLVLNAPAQNVDQHMMVNVVKAPLDVALQYPLCRNLLAQYGKDVLAGILRTPALSEPEGRCVRCRFRYGVESQRIQRLHRPVVHTGDSQWTLRLFPRLLDVDPAERLCLIPFVCQGQHTAHF